MNVPLVIARHYLAQQKGAFSFITRLAVLATGLSVAVMLIALAVVTGFETTVKEKLYSFNGHIHIIRFDPSQSFTRTTPPIAVGKGLMDSLRRLPHVNQAFTFAERPVIVQSKGLMEGLELKGVDRSYHFPNSVDTLGGYLAYPDSGYSKNMLLSDVTAARLCVGIGDTVQIEFFQEDGLPRIRRLRICGLFHTGMVEIDKHYALCDIALIQRLNGWTADSINAVQLDLDDEVQADTLANFIHTEMINPPLEALTTRENFPQIFDWLELQRMNSLILLIIIGVVAIINMSAILVILMVDRTVMIGLLKVLGMTMRDTVRIFYAAGFLLGGCGIVLGNALAIALAAAQQRFHFITLQEETYNMKYAPISLQWEHIALTDIACLAILALCMWLPALYIRTIQPAKALHFR